MKPEDLNPKIAQQLKHMCNVPATVARLYAADKGREWKKMNSIYGRGWECKLNSGMLTIMSPSFST